MNYSTIARDLGCSNISDVRVSIGNRYVLSASTSDAAQNTEFLLRDLLSNLKRVSERVLLEDHYTGEVLSDRIDGLGQYLSQQSASQRVEPAGSLNVELIPLTFKEQLWKHLVNKYEYLRADMEGNFDRFKDFVSWLMELLCEQYEARFLKEADEDDNYMQFGHYVEHTIDILDGVVRRKAALSDDYFQKRYYLLKEELAVQEKALSVALKMSAEANLVDICERVGEQQAAIGRSVANIMRDIDGLRGCADVDKFKSSLETARGTLAAILSDLSDVKEVRKREKKVVVDGYFLPFHRVRTYTNMRESRGSRRSTSMQNSKNMVSERVSYDSQSRQLLTSRLNPSSDFNATNHRKIRKNYSDHSLSRRGILEDANDNTYSVHEPDPVDLKELIKCKGVLAELGFSEEVLGNAQVTGLRVHDYISLGRQCEALDAECVRLTEQLEAAAREAKRAGQTETARHEEAQRFLENKLNEAQRQAKTARDDAALEKSNAERLSGVADELRARVAGIKAEIEGEKEKSRQLAADNQAIVASLHQALAPRIQHFRAELEEVTSLVTDGYVQNLMETYKQLKDRKLELSDELIDFLKMKCEQFDVDLENTSKHAQALAQLPDLSQATAALAQLVSYPVGKQHASAVRAVEGRLKAAADRLQLAASNFRSRLAKLESERARLSDELQASKKERRDLAAEHSRSVAELQQQYKQEITGLSKALEDRSDQISELTDQIQAARSGEAELIASLQRAVAEHGTQSALLSQELAESHRVAQELREQLSKQAASRLELSTEFGGIDDELEKLNIMNSKLVGEIEIMTRRGSEQKSTIEALSKRLAGHEELLEKVEELTLNNKILEGKMEMLESCKSADENERARRLVDGTTAELTATDAFDGSLKNSNKTIQEVDEGLERSDIEHSCEGSKNRSPALGRSMREASSSLYRARDIKKSDFLLTTISSNYTFTRARDDEREYSSPRTSAVKKHIFSADSIIKNIEALRRSNNSVKTDELRETNARLNGFMAADKQKARRLRDLLELVDDFAQRIEISAPVDRIVGLEERVSQLRAVLADHDLESLARPKRDSNLIALTEQSHSSHNQSYDVDDADRPSAKLVSPLKLQGLAHRGEKPGERQLRLGGKPAGAKKATKPAGLASPHKKPQTRAVKDSSLRGSKFSNNSARSNRKEPKRAGAEHETVERAVSAELLRAQDELKSRVIELTEENDALAGELESLRERSEREAEILKRAFEIALPLVEEQIEDTADLDPLYLDQIVEVVKSKIGKYEEALDSLQQEVEAMRQSYHEQQAAEDEPEEQGPSPRALTKSVVEVDLEAEQAQAEEPDAEQLTDMKRAFDELICEMFTVAADNIDNIANLESYIAEDAEAEGDELQGVAREDVANELDKIKTFTLRLKEMIEVLYENLMTYMSEVQSAKPRATVRPDDEALASLQAENEYLCKRLETFNENYQELNKKYLALLSDRNAAIGKSTSTPELEFGEQPAGDGLLKDKMRKFIQSNINFAQGAPEAREEPAEQRAEHEGGADEQVYQLTYVLRRISQIMKSESTDDYKIMKIEDILENPESQCAKQESAERLQGGAGGRGRPRLEPPLDLPYAGVGQAERQPRPHLQGEPGALSRSSSSRTRSTC